jgi:PAS domain S-box-containing protein
MRQTRIKTRSIDADQASHAIEEHLRLILDAIPAIVWRKLPDGSADFLNMRFLEYTGLSLEKGMGWGWMEAFHPDDRLKEEWRAALAAGKPFEKEARLRRADGVWRWFQIRAVPLRDEHGNVVKWYGTTSDIEDRKQAEDRLRLVIDRIPTMAWSLRPDGVVDFVNQRSLDYMGLTLEQELADPAGAVHPEDLPRVMEKWLADMAAGEPSEDEMRMRRADGEYRWFLVRTVPFRDEEGKIVKWYGTSIDIDDRKRAEVALRSSEQEQRHIAAQLERERARLVEAQEVAIIGSWEAELPGLNVIWSEQTHRIFETDPSRFDPTRPKFREFIHPEDGPKVDAAFVASLDRRSPCTVEYRIVMPDSRVKIVEERWRAFHDEEGKPVRLAGTCRDITERVRAEEELRRLSGELLRSQDEERRKIARDLHDSTGQDLVALATMLGQLRESIPSAQRKSRRLLSECKALSDKCIRDVRTLSYVLHPPMLDEAGLGDAIRDYVGGFSKRSGIHVELELSPRLGRMERGVELALFRVVQESLTNIQRHSGSQRAKIRIYRNSNLTLEISDRIHAASANVRRAKEVRRFKVGVGIAGMRERARLIGGRLEIDSTSHGTTVRVTIPLAGERK